MTLDYLVYFLFSLIKYFILMTEESNINELYFNELRMVCEVQYFTWDLTDQ